MRPARKREMVDHVRVAWRVSIRRACHAVPVDRSTYHYRSKRAGQAPLSRRIKEIAETRVRYGYRRIHVLLRREGWPVNVKRVCRLYREQGLQLRNKSPKRRVKAQLRADRSQATAPNQIWAMDFVHDQLFDGRKIRILTIVDTFQGSRRRSTPASPTAAPMSSRRLTRLRFRAAIPRPFASTTAPSSSARSSTCGPSCMT
jgi:putative transposase